MFLFFRAVNANHTLHSLAGTSSVPAASCDSWETGDLFLQSPDESLYGCLCQAGDIGSISLQIALQLVYLLQILLCSGAAPGSIHPYGNLFHNIVGPVKFSDNTVYQFPVAEAKPGPDLFMHMIAVAEVLVIPRQPSTIRSKS